MARKKLLVFPCNGNGIESLDCIDAEQYEVLGFIDDDRSKHMGDYPILSRGILADYRDVQVLAVPGSPVSYKERAGIISGLNLSPDRFATIVHPGASIGKNVRIGFNTLIMAGVVLTSNAVISNHVCILPNSVVHHDSIINDYTLIGSNVVIAGGCSVRRNCYIGSGANIINGVTIGAFALVGLGSNIIHDVAEHAKMAGNPARNLNTQFV